MVEIEQSTLVIELRLLDHDGQALDHERKSLVVEW